MNFEPYRLGYENGKGAGYAAAVADVVKWLRLPLVHINLDHEDQARVARWIADVIALQIESGDWKKELKNERTATDS